MESNKRGNSNQETPKSTLQFSAQVRCYENRVKSKKPKNPFERDLGFLEKAISSPDLFSTVDVTVPETEFTWSIDDISKLKPAVIDSPASVASSLDEATESRAQDAIDRYFREHHQILTPPGAYTGVWVSPAKEFPFVPTASTPQTQSHLRGSSSRTENVSCQTELCLPPVLPAELESLLQQYAVAPGEETLNSSGLRRKLLFHHEEADMSIDEVEVKLNLNCGYTDSPTQPGTRVQLNRKSSWGRKRGSDVDADSSSPDISPIKSSPLCVMILD